MMGELLAASVHSTRAADLVFRPAGSARHDFSDSPSAQLCTACSGRYGSTGRRVKSISINDLQRIYEWDIRPGMPN